MTFILIPSLQHFAAVRVAIELITKCKIPEIRDEPEMKLPECGRQRRVVVKKALEHVGQIGLPEVLKSELEHAVTCVGSELQYPDFDYLAYGKVDPKSYAACMSFTTFGTIRKKESFELLLTRKENVRKKWCFHLACTFVCDDLIPVLWEQLPPLDKQYFLIGENAIGKYSFLQFTNSVTQDELSQLVIEILEEHPDRSVLVSLAADSQKKESDAAFAYYWNKLSEEEKDRNVTHFAHVELRRITQLFGYYSDILLILIFHMNPESLIKLVEEFPYQIVIYLLDGWTRQNFVLPLVPTVWNFLSDNQYLELANAVGFGICPYSTLEKNCQKMFAELCTHVPHHLEKSFKKRMKRVCDWQKISEVLYVKFVGNTKL